MAELVPQLLNLLSRKGLEVWKRAIIPFPLCLLMIIRVLLVAIPKLNQCIHIAEVIYTENVHIVVFMTGLFLFLECSASTLSFCYHLKLWQLIKETRIRNLISWHVLTIVVLTLCSVLYTVCVFMLVRSIWTCHFFVLIQFLHAFPTILLVLQSASQGAFLICMTARPRHDVWSGAVEDFPLHMQSHRRLNLVLLVYSLSMLIVTLVAGNHGNLSHGLVQALYCLGVLEVISRLFSAYATNVLSRPPNDHEAELVVPVQATDDVTPLAGTYKFVYVLPHVHSTYKFVYVLPHVHSRDRIEHGVDKFDFIIWPNSSWQEYQPVTRDSFPKPFPYLAGDIPQAVEVFDLASDIVLQPVEVHQQY